MNKLVDILTELKHVSIVFRCFQTVELKFLGDVKLNNDVVLKGVCITQCDGGPVYTRFFLNSAIRSIGMLLLLRV